ncbi:MAG: type 4a pilus biogenesis protein PilO [Candidatus Sumerlaeia bacterium]|nr:type 4a pilus biogenesis protein PilO [Candidatus Sumerlaeia bacterium]
MNEKQKQALIGGVIGAVLLTALIIYLNMMFFSDSRTKHVADIKKFEQQIATSEKKLRDLEKVLEDEEERRRLDEIVTAARRRLPDNPEAIDFIDIIRESARRTGLSFSALKPVAIRNRDSYREIPYEVTGSARYHEFGQFLNLIECHPERFMRVNSFTMTNDPKRPSIHPVKVEISTFMFQE